jgi:hypothetical protein
MENNPETPTGSGRADAYHSACWITTGLALAGGPRVSEVRRGTALHCQQAKRLLRKSRGGYQRKSRLSSRWLYGSPRQGKRCSRPGISSRAPITSFAWKRSQPKGTARTKATALPKIARSPRAPPKRLASQKTTSEAHRNKR